MSIVKVQSVTFNRKMWTPYAARRWLAKEGFMRIKPVDITTNYYRYRLRHPSQFKRFRSKKFKNGIVLVFGIK